MGLPIFALEFKKKAETIVKRSSRGVVATILIDKTKNGAANEFYSYSSYEDIHSDDWGEMQIESLKLIFMGNPKRVIVQRAQDLNDCYSALEKLKNRRWNWLTVPQMLDLKPTEDGEKIFGVDYIADWIKKMREQKKTFKAVLSGIDNPDCEGIVNFDSDNIRTSDGEIYISFQYCARIAGILAGMSLDESATGYVLPEVKAFDESSTPDADIDSGKMILIHDGEDVKIARAVNSLTTLGDTKTEDMKKIKIMEAFDMIFDDICDTFENSYRSTTNSYDNKQLFVAEVNNYFDMLASQEILDPNAENYAEISIEKQREWLSEHGKDVEAMTDEQIKTAKTGSYIFLKGAVEPLDAMEDIAFDIYI